MNDLGQDVRLALRTLVRNRSFSIVVVLTLALGIGANTAIFTLMDQVLLRPLPVPHPEQLVLVNAPGPDSGMRSMQLDEPLPLSRPMIAGLAGASDVFQGVLGYYKVPIHLTVGTQTQQVDGALVTGSYFEVLKLQPAAGRLFTQDDDRVSGGHPVVVISHLFWKNRFNGDPGVVGRSVLVDSRPMTVVGVAPAGFNGVEIGEATDMYVPVAMQAQLLPWWKDMTTNWRARWLVTMARVKDGLTREQAITGANVAYARLLNEDLAHLETKSESFRQRFLQKKLQLLPGGRGPSGLREQSQTPLVVLMAMVGLVLLIACANVANLLLVRASSRQKEIAVRLALGASRLRLVRQLLVESVIYAVMGAVLGLAVAGWTSSLLLRALPFDNAAVSLSAEPDLRVGLFAFALALFTGVVFGLVPALQSTRPHLAPTLKAESGAVAGGGTTFRFRKGLVIAQIALSLLLLVGAGLFTRSLMNLRRLDPGFRPESLLTFSVNPSLNGYDVQRRMAVVRQIRDELAAEPGVTNVGVAEIGLMTQSNSSSTVVVDGYTAKEGEDMNPNFNGISPGFFNTMGIPIVRGRDFTEADALDAPQVAIVNEVFAKYYFGDGDPVGHQFRYGRDDKPVVIVGMVRDGRNASMREEPKRYVYTPYQQDDTLADVTFYVRTANDPAALGGRVQQLVSRADANLPVTEMRTMEARIGESLYVDRIVASLSAAFGFLATLLAAIGLYGVMSHAVAMRTREIGIRMALGAERRMVIAMVLQEVAILTAIGIGIGLPSGYGLGRAVESQLFGLKAADPATFAIATLALVGASLLAGLVPAARATRVDPLIALRYE